MLDGSYARKFVQARRRAPHQIFLRVVTRSADGPLAITWTDVKGGFRMSHGEKVGRVGTSAATRTLVFPPAFD